MYAYASPWSGDAEGKFLKRKELALDFDLSAKLDYAVGRDAVVIGSVARIAM